MAAIYMSKTDMVAATLRELLLTGEFIPGQPVRQRDLAERLGVSPTPVREALRRLEAEGLVRVDPHRGATVAESDRGATEENYQIRAALESLGAALAAQRITEKELKPLEEINAGLAAIPEDDPRYGKLNFRLHFAIYECAHSPLLLALLRLLWQSMPDGPKVLRSHAESAAQHESLLKALRARDPQRASEVTREHILGSAHLEIFSREKIRESSGKGRRDGQVHAGHRTGDL